MLLISIQYENVTEKQMDGNTDTIPRYRLHYCIVQSSEVEQILRITSLNY